MYWAQSQTHVYLDIRFSHIAADSEPCLKLDDLKIEFEPDRLKLSGLCGIKGRRVKYILNIPLSAPIKVRESSYQVLTGHAEIALVKEARGLWTEVSEKKPGVVEKWWRKQRLIDTLSQL